jgi:hypothetical protein
MSGRKASRIWSGLKTGIMFAQNAIPRISYVAAEAAEGGSAGGTVVIAEE